MSEPATLALPKPAAMAGFSLRHHIEIDSTNASAKAALREGADRLWIVADIQTAGRGRHDRRWVSPAGNLHATLALANPCEQKQLPLMGFVAGVALARAVRSLAVALEGRAQLKWPNDLLIDGAKASGILLEAAPDARGGSGLVMGIGVNVVEAPEGLDQPVAALAHSMPDITRNTLFAALANEMITALALFDRGAGFSALREAWLALSLPIGHRVRVRLPDGAREGLYLGIDPSGSLLVKTQHGVETILAGDVFAI